MDDDDTIWIERLKQGDVQAAEVIWQRYNARVASLARQRLKGMPRREMDEEDLALSSFNSLFCGISARQFPKLDDRIDLWKLLAVITSRKVSTQYKRHLAIKRGRGQINGESVFDNPIGLREHGIGQVVGPQQSAVSMAVFADSLAVLMHQLGDESLQRIAKLRMEGFDNEEIAQKLGCVRRTVERKLKLIQQMWQQNDSAERVENVDRPSDCHIES